MALKHCQGRLFRHVQLLDPPTYSVKEPVKNKKVIMLIINLKKNSCKYRQNICFIFDSVSSVMLNHHKNSSDRDGVIVTL